MSSKQKTSINMSHLYSSNEGFANGFMSFLWEAKKAPQRAPACRGNPKLSRTAPFGEPHAWPHISWETGGDFPMQHLHGWWDSWGWGKCHSAQHSWPLRGPWGGGAEITITCAGSGAVIPRVLGLKADLPPHPKCSGSVNRGTTGKSLAEWRNRSWILPMIVILHEICSGINKNIDRNCLQRVLSPLIAVFRNTLMFHDTADVTWRVTHWAATFRNF